MHAGGADSAIEAAVLDKPVGHLAQVQSASGYHLIEVLREGSAEAASANTASRGTAAASTHAAAPAPGQILSASVHELDAALKDEAQVCAHAATGSRCAEWLRRQYAVLLHAAASLHQCERRLCWCRSLVSNAFEERLIIMTPCVGLA